MSLPLTPRGPAAVRHHPLGYEPPTKRRTSPGPRPGYRPPPTEDDLKAEKLELEQINHSLEVLGNAADKPALQLESLYSPDTTTQLQDFFNIDGGDFNQKDVDQWDKITAGYEKCTTGLLICTDTQNARDFLESRGFGPKKIEADKEYEEFTQSSWQNIGAKKTLDWQ